MTWPSHNRPASNSALPGIAIGGLSSFTDHLRRAAPELGYRIAGFISNGSADPKVQPVLGGLTDIPDIVRDHVVGEVIIAWAGISHHELIDIVTGCTREGVDIKFFPRRPAPA